MRMYCKKCGTPTEYTLSKPKFCAGCGTPFSASSAQNLQKTTNIEQPPTASTTNTIAQIQEEEIDRIPDIQGLDMEIEGFSQGGVKFGDALGSNPGEERYDVHPEDGLPTQSKEDFLKEFQKEAGSIRNQRNTAADQE